MRYCLALLFIIFIFFVSCENRSNEKKVSKGDKNTMEIIDIHSFAKPDQALVKHLDLDVTVDFESKKIFGVASLTIEKTSGADKLILDTKNLNIDHVTLDSSDQETTFTMGNPDENLGSALNINIKPETKRVNIFYSTSENAEALQWLLPVQTAGGKHPFLFTQSQAILARSWIPLQDSPGIRFTYNAKVKVPKELLALMSAENPVEKNQDGVYTFKMEQPIPAYLMALSVGNLVFEPIGKRTGVYAEPEVIEKAAFEFAEMEKMLDAAEKLYGPYRWERYDLIVLPPSFPFGGMENPRLTFATPTILAGDRSLTSLVAHELAHSWSGNLVTNATWNDFWLNEGFTVYFERRIMEELYGKSYADMLAVLGLNDLKATVNDLKEQNKYEDTKLKLDLSERNPDDGVTDIAYEKGYFFIRTLEDKVGREKLDAFLKNYFNENAFKSMTTESFIDYLNKNLFEKNNIEIDTSLYNEWIYSTGIPPSIPNITSERFDAVDAELTKWKSGTKASELKTKNWTSHEWLHFINQLPQQMSIAQMKDLDSAFNLTNTGNSEILAAWLTLAVKNNYKESFSSLEKFLVSAGRRKFLIPLYTELAKTNEGKVLALKIYKKARPNYHFVSTNTVDKILDYK